MGEEDWAHEFEKEQSSWGKIAGLFFFPPICKLSLRVSVSPYLAHYHELWLTRLNSLIIYYAVTEQVATPGRTGEDWQRRAPRGGLRRSAHSGCALPAKDPSPGTPQGAVPPDKVAELLGCIRNALSPKFTTPPTPGMWCSILLSGLRLHPIFFMASSEVGENKQDFLNAKMEAKQGAGNFGWVMGMLSAPPSPLPPERPWGEPKGCLPSLAPAPRRRVPRGVRSAGEGEGRGPRPLTSKVLFRK